MSGCCFCLFVVVVGNQRDFTIAVCDGKGRECGMECEFVECCVALFLLLSLHSACGICMQECVFWTEMVGCVLIVW